MKWSLEDLRDLLCFRFSSILQENVPPPPRGCQTIQSPTSVRLVFFPHTGWPLLWAKTIPNHTYHSICHTHRIHFQIDIGLILLFFAKQSSHIVLVSVSGVRCEHPLQSKPKKHHFSQVIIRKRQLHNGTQSCTLPTNSEWNYSSLIGAGSTNLAAKNMRICKAAGWVVVSGNSGNELHIWCVGQGNRVSLGTAKYETAPTSR